MASVRNVSDELYNEICESTPLSELLSIAKDTAAFLERGQRDAETNRNQMAKIRTIGLSSPLNPGMYNRMVYIDELFLLYLKSGKKHDKNQIEYNLPIYKNEVHEIIDRLVFPEDEGEEPFMFLFDKGSLKTHENDDAVRVACEDLKGQYEAHISMWRLIQQLRKRISEKCKC